MSGWTGYMVAAGVWLIVARTTPDGQPMREGFALLTAAGFQLMAIIEPIWRIFRDSKDGER